MLPGCSHDELSDVRRVVSRNGFVVFTVAGGGAVSLGGDLSPHGAVSVLVLVILILLAQPLELREVLPPVLT
jgi:hypothetical protein